MLLLGCGLRLERTLLQQRFDLRRIRQRRRVEPGSGFLDCREIHADAASIFLDSGENPLAQPRDVAVQPLVCSLAGGQEHQHLTLGLFETFAERRDRRR